MLSSAFRHDRVHHAHDVASMTLRMGGDAKAVGGSERLLSPAVATRVAVKTTASDGAVPRHLRVSMPQRTADDHATHHLSSCSSGKRNPPCGKCAASASPCNGSWYRPPCATRLPRVQDRCRPESTTCILVGLSVDVIALVGRLHRRKTTAWVEAFSSQCELVPAQPGHGTVVSTVLAAHEAWRGSPVAA